MDCGVTRRLRARYSALAALPATAQDETPRERNRQMRETRGGDGAAREFCDLLLMASGRYASLLAHYCA